jgi:hypothetical protein
LSTYILVSGALQRPATRLIAKSGKTFVSATAAARHRWRQACRSRTNGETAYLFEGNHMSLRAKKPRIMTKGQWAMLGAKNSLERPEGFYSADTMAKARTIVEHTPLLVDAVIGGRLPFGAVYKEARYRKMVAERMAAMKGRPSSIGPATGDQK